MSEEYRSANFSSWQARVPSHWGRSTWDALFLLASDYPHNQECDDDDVLDAETVRTRRKMWRTLLKTLPWILTCGVCAEHFKRYVDRDNGRALERALKDRESLFHFLYKCKDEVNRRSGKTSPPYKTIRKRYIPPCERRSSGRRRGR